MHEPVITVVGNVGREPRQRVVASGVAVADFRVASTPRRFDKSTNSWTDVGTTWFAVTCWRTLAEHCAQSLKKGDRVIVTGKLTTRTWSNDQGEERSSLEIEAAAVGLELTRAPALQQRPPRPSGEADDPEAAVAGSDDEVVSDAAAA